VPELVGRWACHLVSSDGAEHLFAVEDERALAAQVLARTGEGLDVSVTLRGAAAARAEVHLRSHVRALVEADDARVSTLDARVVDVVALRRGEGPHVASAAPLRLLGARLSDYDRRFAPWRLQPRSTPFVVALESASRFPDHLVSLFVTQAGRRVAQILRRGRVAGDSPRAVLEWSDGPAPFDCTGCVVRVEHGITIRAYVIGGHSVARPLVSCEVDWVEGVVTALGEMAFEVFAEVLSLDDGRGPAAIRER